MTVNCCVCGKPFAAFVITMRGFDPRLAKCTPCRKAGNTDRADGTIKRKAENAINKKGRVG